jgi:phosphoribosyl-AMP cyclohydrolase / phosphoribosyl-ATP pyrophosphohydrolase
MSLAVTDLNRIDFAKGGGLVPTVVQHAETGAVLMVGCMNRDALEATLARGRVVFWSRSKGRLWEKGETSGHHLDLVSAQADCDADALLVLARPRGPVCHSGAPTCFGGERHTRAERLGFLAVLEQVIEQRTADRPEDSYTARLFAQGLRRIAQKVGEEGLEVAMAAAGETDDKVVAESADLLYHLMVLLKSRGLSLARVLAELEGRHAGRAEG